MPFVDSIEQALLNHFFTDPAYTPPATLYIGLSTTTPTDAGGNVTEPVGNAYARQAVTATEMAAASGTAPAVKDNSSVITYPQATGSWGTVTHFTVHDQLTTGAVLAWGALAASRSIENGDTASFALGALDFQLGKGTPG